MFEGSKLLAYEQAKRLAISGGLNAATVVKRLGLGRTAVGRGAIFTLHHVRPHVRRKFEPNAHLEVTPEFLDSALAAILEAGYQPCALSELPEQLKHGNPDRPLAVFTLDDGYRDNAVHAAPVFSKHGVPFTIFVTSGFCERSHTIWWETLEKLLNSVSEFTYDFGNGPELVRTKGVGGRHVAYQRIGAQIIGPNEAEAIDRLNETALAHGVDAHALVDELVMSKGDLKALIANPHAHLGAHTVSHRALSFLSKETTIEEMTASAIYASGVTGRRTGVFAFPYGFPLTVSDREKNLALECGFDLGVTTAPGTLGGAALSHMGGLPRISLNGLYQKARHVMALASGIPFNFKP
jgi:peptidoglycan/xylan/chitin deacetylase (PgdA/CDA1 family)